MKHTAAEGTNHSKSLFTIVKGDLNQEQLAALTAVLLSLSTAAQAEPAHRAQKPAQRQARSHDMRPLPLPGPGAWRRSVWR